MIRITVVDPEKTVSFRGDAALAQAVVASCAAEPALTEDVIIAMESFREGTVARVSHELLRSDELMRVGLSVSPLVAFEAVTQEAERLAKTDDADGLVVVDLVRHDISGWIDDVNPPSSHGRVRITMSDAGLERETVYALGPEWSVSVDSGLPERERAYA